MGHRDIERRESEPNPIKLNVYNETDELKHLAIWGEPGCETVLGQLLPLKKSLFYSQFDVYLARNQYRGMERMIREQGFKVTKLKDVFVESFGNGYTPDPHTPKTLLELSRRLKIRGKELAEKYPSDDFTPDLSVLDLIDPILSEDSDTYGEKLALYLNYELSLRKQLPLANIFFGRDQSNVFGNTMIVSRMRWPIRQAEVGIIVRCYRYLKIPYSPITEGTFEGGDGMMLDNDVYIGVGVRTSRLAAKQIYSYIHKDLANRGGRFYIAVDPKMEELKPEEAGPELAAMHWDTWIGPIDSSTYVGCYEEMSKRHIEELAMVDGEVQTVNKESVFDHFSRKEIDVRDIPTSEQQDYAPNYLHFGIRKGVLSPHLNNKICIQHILERNVPIYNANIQELTKGQGAAHCMTAALEREG